MIKYPEIKVRLLSEDGNAFAILGRVFRAMREAKLSTEQIEEFRTEATSGNYDHFLATCCRYVSVC